MFKIILLTIMFLFPCFCMASEINIDSTYAEGWTLTSGNGVQHHYAHVVVSGTVTVDGVIVAFNVAYDEASRYGNSYNNWELDAIREGFTLSAEQQQAIIAEAENSLGGN